MSTSKIFDIPQYYYFEAGNDYIGSLNGMNFKIDNGDNLTVSLYHGVKCFELSEVYQQETFDKNDKGYSNLITWLENEYLKHKQSKFYTTRINLI